MGILGKIIGKLRGSSSGSASDTDAIDVASPAGGAASPTSHPGGLAQRAPEASPHLPTIDMPENSDALDLQAIGQAASGAQRMSDAVTQRHPTEPPLSAKAGSMPSIVGRRNSSHPMSSVASVLRRAGQRILRRTPLGNTDRGVAPADYVQIQAPPIWLERSTITETTGQSPDKAAPTPAAHTVIRRRSSPGPKAVVRRKTASHAAVDNAAPRKPRRSRKALGRTAATVIRRRPELEAMPRVRRKSASPIKTALGKKALTENKPMASPDRWRPREMGAPDKPKGDSESLAGMLDAPVTESRSLNLRPVAQRQPETPTIGSATSASELVGSAAPSENPRSDTPDLTGPSSPKSLLSKGRDIIFRRSSDEPTMAGLSLNSKDSARSAKPAPTPVQRQTNPAISEKPASKPGIARRIKQIAPGGVLAAKVSREKPSGQPAVQAVPASDGPASAAATAPEPAKAQRIPEVPTQASPGPVIDVQSRTLSPDAQRIEAPVETHVERESVDSTASHQPVAEATPETRANPAKRLLNGARELVFRMSARSESGDFTKPKAVAQKAAVSATAASQNVPVQPVPRPATVDSQDRRGVPPFGGPLEQTRSMPGASSTSLETAQRAPEPASGSNVSRDTDPRAQRMVFRKDSTGASDVMGNAGKGASNAASTAAAHGPVTGPPSRSIAGRMTAPRMAMRRVRRTISKATGAVTRPVVRPLVRPFIRRKTKSAVDGSNAAPATEQPSARPKDTGLASVAATDTASMADVSDTRTTEGASVRRSGGLMSVARKLIFRTFRPPKTDAGPHPDVSSSGTSVGEAAAPLKRKATGRSSVATLARDTSTTIRRGSTSSLPAAEPMAHAAVVASVKPDVQRLVDGAQKARIPQPTNAHESTPRRRASHKGSSPIRRVIEMAIPQTYEPSSNGAPTSRLQRSMEGPVLTHARRPASSTSPVAAAHGGVNGTHSAIEAEPTFVAEPRRTLRGVQRNVRGLESIAVPVAERPKLGATRPIVHRKAAPVPTAAAPIVAKGVGAVNASKRQKAQRTAVAPDGPNGSGSKRVQRVVRESVSPSITTSTPDSVARVVEEPSVSEAEPTAAPISMLDKYGREDIDYLSAKVYMYIKQKLRVDRERSGNPGFALWR